MKQRKKKQVGDIRRFTPSPDMGLTKEEAESRQKDGLFNLIPKSNAKPIWKILFDNICTFFNFIWAVLFGINLYLFIIGENEIGNLFFIAVILANTALAVIQEIRAKLTVERLSLVTAPKIDVIREGEHLFLPSEELLLDDVVVLTTGNQIPADCILLTGKAEMNESLLTGESDAVKKAPGDLLYAGSFITGGGGQARIDKIGNDSYIQTVAKAAKAFKSPKSDLFRDINRIVFWIGVAIVPLFALTLWNNIANLPAVNDVYDAIISATSAIQGMIPAGMFLLITVALSVGVVKLAFKRTLVKDVYSVEMLSRTNMLCLDKTGTVTDGTMRVYGDCLLLPGTDVRGAVSAIMSAQNGKNFTADALLQHYGENREWEVTYNIPFSSKRKFTATAFKNKGSFAIGAPEFLNVGEIPAELHSKIDEEAKNGRRVLMLAYSECLLSEDALPPMTPAALVILEDHIREEAPDTIRWFRENNVKIKIISGDNPVTVAAIAGRVGVENAEMCISLDGMSDDEVVNAADRYTVFGRVSPEQKHILVKTLKRLGYVVSMTGDGVNDTLALKEADCSIAMADGSEVARSISNIVLLDNNFACLPSVVREGRQVVNNVQRASTLFLMKTLCVICLTVGCILFSIPYAFSGPGMLMLLEVFVTGLPSVILALEPNDRLIEGSFVREVLKRCVPNGLLMLLNVVAALILHYAFGWFTSQELTSVIAISFTLAGFINLVSLCIPITKLRAATVLFSAVMLTLCISLLGDLFGIPVMGGGILLTCLVFFLVSIPLHFVLDRLWKLLFQKIDTFKKKKSVKA